MGKRESDLAISCNDPKKRDATGEEERDRMDGRRTEKTEKKSE